MMTSAMLGLVLTHYGLSWLLIIAGAGLLIGLFAYGLIIGHLEYGDRKKISRERKWVFEGLDAIEYLARAGTNLADLTIASIKLHPNAIPESDGDTETLGAFLTRYQDSMRDGGQQDSSAPPKKLLDQQSTR